MPLERYLNPAVNSEFHDILFSESSNGPLASFDAKIRMAYCLGIIDEPTKSDLDAIRRVRNGFAHSIPHHSFTIDTIRDAVFSLNIMNRSDIFSDESLMTFLGGFEGNILD